MIVVIYGPVGSGKSTVAEEVARRLGAKVINSDRLRKELAGIGPYDRGGEGFGRGIYTPEFTERVYSEMIARAVEEASKGIPVVLDATFSKRMYRKRLAEAARGRGVEVRFFYMDVPEEEIKRRLEKRKGGPSVSDADWEVYRRMSFDSPDEGTVVDGMRSPQEIAEEIVKGLGR